jgi:hypothetical protein
MTQKAEAERERIRNVTMSKPTATIVPLLFPKEPPYPPPSSPKAPLAKARPVTTSSKAEAVAKYTIAKAEEEERRSDRENDLEYEILDKAFQGHHEALGDRSFDWSDFKTKYIDQIVIIKKDMLKHGKTELNTDDEHFIVNMFKNKISYHNSPLYSVELDDDSDVDLGNESSTSANIKNYYAEDSGDEGEKKYGPSTRLFKVRDQETANTVNQRLYDRYGITTNVTVTKLNKNRRTDASELGRKLHKYDKKAFRWGYEGTIESDIKILRMIRLKRVMPRSFPGPFEHRMARDLTFSQGVHAAGRNANFREFVESWAHEKGPSNIRGLKRKMQNIASREVFKRRSLPRTASPHHDDDFHDETQGRSSSSSWRARR